MKEQDLFGNLENQSKEVAVSKAENVNQAQNIFAFENMQVDTILKDNAVFFKLTDIEKVLGLTAGQSAKWIKDSWFDSDEIVELRKAQLGGHPLKYVAESGLYRILNRTNSPKAKPFERWVTKEVLPTIRKTGSYSLAQQPKLPKSYAEALRELADKVEKVAELENKIETDKPLVEYATDILLAENSQSIGDFAKFLASRGCTTGQNRFFAWLRANHFLKSDNTAYQKYVDCGYFQMLPQAYKNGDKRTLTWKTLITPKGQYYFTKYFLGNEKGNAKLLADIQSGKIKANIVEIDR